MPNLFDREYNRHTQDGDDCPPHPFSMAYGGNDDYDDPKDAWDFVVSCFPEQVVNNKKSEDYDPVPAMRLAFEHISRETEKAWCIQVYRNSGWAWFPKSLCCVDKTKRWISGPTPFMKKKVRELSPGVAPDGPKFEQPKTPVTIVVNNEPCPYCGKSDACDCATPGIVATRIPALSEADIARLKLQNFIKENR